jgi:large subunit ribosomal protein L23
MPLLKKPVINEKFAKLNQKGVYGFIVDKNANKIEIKKAVESMFGVNVDSVNTMLCIGKVKNRSTKTRFISGRKSSYKKAIVTLAQGETIDIYAAI